MQLRPATRADLRAVHEVYAAYDLAHRGFVDGDEADVRRDWDVPGFDMAERTRVLEQDGEVVGYAVVGTTGDADTVTRPGVGGDDLLLEFVEAFDEALHHYLPADDATAVDRMTRRGWTPDRTYWRMRVDLVEPVPEPVWPAGAQVRSMTADADKRAAHDLIQTAFLDVGDGHVRRDFDTWAASVLAPDKYDPELYQVVEQAGEVVAAVVAQEQAEFGFVPQLAVAAAARGQGLGLALLHDTFRRCAARGLPAVELGVDASNATGATRLYERAGMRVNESFTRWSWTPRPAGGTS